MFPTCPRHTQDGAPEGPRRPQGPQDAGLPDVPGGDQGAAGARRVPAEELRAHRLTEGWFGAVPQLRAAEALAQLGICL